MTQERKKRQKTRLTSGWIIRNKSIVYDHFHHTDGTRAWATLMRCKDGFYGTAASMAAWIEYGPALHYEDYEE